jgi:hypothetical protein
MHFCVHCHCRYVNAGTRHTRVTTRCDPCLICCAGNFNYNYRLLYCFGKQGLLGFGPCATTHRTRHTPIVAIVGFSFVALAGALTAAFLAGAQADTQPAWTAYGWLGFVGTLPVIVIYMLTQPALYCYMRQYQPTHFNVWKHAVLPAITFALYMVPLVGNFWPDPPQSPYNYFVFALLGWIGVSACIVLYYRRRSPETLAKISHLFDSINDT